LAGAVVAEHADLGARQERQRDVLEHLLVRREGLGEAVHREDVLGRHRRPRLATRQLTKWCPASISSGSRTRSRASTIAHAAATSSSTIATKSWASRRKAISPR